MDAIDLASPSVRCQANAVTVHSSSFSLRAPHGEIVGVRLLEDDLERVHEHPALHPDEARRASELRGARRTGFVAGRLALSRALSALGAPRVAIGSDDRGAPTLPNGFIGSISHKGALGVALVALDEGERVGVDVELVKELREGVERLVLTEGERARLGPDRARVVLASFSVKESIYKAIDPFVRRWVGYHEAVVELPDERAMREGFAPVKVSLSLANGERIDRLEAFVTERDGHYLSTARARSHSPS